MDDPKNTNSVQDYEMGPDDGPKINRFTSDIRNPEEAKSDQPLAVDPKDDVPKMTLPEARIGRIIPPKMEKPKRPPVNPEARRKALLGCLGGLGIVMILFLIVAMVFISQSGGENGEGPIARLLGINEASFVNGLIILTHIIFVITALIALVFTMVGLFRASMAKREDKEMKKRGLRLSLFAGLSFLLVMIVWVFMYLYLDTKWVVTGDDAPINAIVTIPEETLNITVPLEIRFDGSKIPVDSKNFQVISYKWDFDDGSTGTKQIETHTYKSKDADGRYDVTLTVTLRNKNNGEEQELTYEHTITVADEALFASFEADPQAGAAPLKVSFDASESSDPDGKISSYEWDFDEDGEFDDGEGVKVDYTFEKVGTYVVVLRITNVSGDFEVAEKEIVVAEDELPKPVIDVVGDPTSFVIGTQYVFKADASTSPNGKITDYEWNFGGNNTYKTKSANFTFKEAGTYQITLKVKDEDDKESELVKVVNVSAVKGAPKAKISTTPALAAGNLSLKGGIPFTVSFSASGTTDSDDNVVDYEWDFNGDGTVDKYGENVSYTFTQEGNYAVGLTVTDADGNIGKATISVTAEPQGVIAILKSNKIDGSVPLTVSFDASASSYSKGSITSYEWDFGDNTAVKLGNAQITHKYTEIGTYKATVTVISSDNTKASASVNITVREIALAACFKAAFLTGKAPLENIFDPACSSGTVASYYWDFGDGSSSSAVKPTHTFSNAGTYPVTLEITDASNTVSTSTVNITVTGA